MVSVGGLMSGAMGGAAVTISINAVDKFSKTFTKATSGLGILGKAGGIALGAIAIAATAVTAATVGIGIASVKSFKSIETGYAKVNTLLDEGVVAQDEYADTVKRLSDEFGLQGGQLGVLDGLYQTISAGITDTADATLFLEKATVSAVGGSAELSTVINAGTKTMAAFGIEVEDSEKVFDIFAATVKAGQTTMGELANAFPQVAGLAGEMGMSLEETTGMFAGLTKVLSDSNLTATGMKAILTQLLKPQEELQAGLKTLGFESGKAAIEQLGLMGTLEALKGSVDGDTTALGQMFGNVRAITSVLPAVGKASDDITESINMTTNAVGLSNKQYEDMANTTEHQMGRVKNSMNSAFNTIGTILGPMVASASEKFADFLGGLDTEKIAEFVTAVTEFLIPIFENVKGLIIDSLPYLKEFFITVLENGQKQWENMKPIIEVFTKAFMKFYDIVYPKVKEFFITTMEKGLELWEIISEFIADNEPTITKAIENIGHVIGTVFDVLGWVSEILIDIVKWLDKVHVFDVIMFGLMLVTEGIVAIIDWIKVGWNVIKWIWDKITNVLSIIGSEFKTLGYTIEGVWEIIKLGAKTAANFVITIFEGAINNVIDSFNAFIRGAIKTANKIPLVNLDVNKYLLGSVEFGRLDTSSNEAELARIQSGIATEQTNIVVQIENLVGLNVDEISEALQEQLEILT